MLFIKNKFPDIKCTSNNVYKVDKCQHGKECTFYFSMFKSELLQMSCNWCSEEILGTSLTTTIHSKLCCNYNCMCDLEPKNVLHFLYNIFNTKLPFDMIEYLVPFYIKQYTCNFCTIANLHLNTCIHCHNQVCKGCTIDYCDKCQEILLCRQCLHEGYNYFTTILHNIDCHYCLNNTYCKMCSNKLLKKCGWCLQYTCPNIIEHDCDVKQDTIYDKRAHYWLKTFTDFDNCFQEMVDWYQAQDKPYQVDILYEAMQLEALEKYLELGNDVYNIPKSLRWLVQK